jgi:hypothetical protein
MKMSNLKNILPQLKSLVAEGIYADNLEKIMHLCQELLVTGEYPTVFYVLQSVCSGLWRSWDDRAVTVDEYNDVRTRLTEPIWSLLDTIQLNMGREVLVERLDILIREFIEVRSRLDWWSRVAYGEEGGEES